MNSTSVDSCTPAKNVGVAYSAGFFDGVASGSLDSARVVLGLLFEVYQPKSVIDIGCGQGAWLSAAEELGAAKLVGVDGPWVDVKKLCSPQISFQPRNLESDFDPGSNFDLCMSVEVAEHLSESAARPFVAKLCSCSSVVLFSAAIPDQGGTMHLNEQPQSYWARLFAERGYECHDFIRPKVWSNHHVDPWYKQNVLVYVRPSHPCAEQFRLKSHGQQLLDVVHPAVYVGNLDNYRRAVESPSLRFCWQTLVKWVKQRFQQSATKARTH